MANRKTAFKPVFLFSLFFVLVAFISKIPNVSADDDLALVMRGVAKTLTSTLEIPKNVIAGSAVAFPMGMVGGVLNGSLRAVSGTLSGAVDIARGAAPYAKYMIFFI